MGTPAEASNNDGSYTPRYTPRTSKVSLPFSYNDLAISLPGSGYRLSSDVFDLSNVSTGSTLRRTRSFEAKDNDSAEANNNTMIKNISKPSQRFSSFMLQQGLGRVAQRSSKISIPSRFSRDDIAIALADSRYSIGSDVDDVSNGNSLKRTRAFPQGSIAEDDQYGDVDNEANLTRSKLSPQLSSTKKDGTRQSLQPGSQTKSGIAKEALPNNYPPRSSKISIPSRVSVDDIAIKLPGGRYSVAADIDDLTKASSSEANLTRSKLSPRLNSTKKDGTRQSLQPGSPTKSGIAKEALPNNYPPRSSKISIPSRVSVDDIAIKLPGGRYSVAADIDDLTKARSSEANLTRSKLSPRPGSGNKNRTRQSTRPGSPRIDEEALPNNYPPRSSKISIPSRFSVDDIVIKLPGGRYSVAADIDDLNKANSSEANLTRSKLSPQPSSANKDEFKQSAQQGSPTPAKEALPNNYLPRSSKISIPSRFSVDDIVIKLPGGRYSVAADIDDLTKANSSEANLTRSKLSPRPGSANKDESKQSAQQGSPTPAKEALPNNFLPRSSKISIPSRFSVDDIVIKLPGGRYSVAADIDDLTKTSNLPKRNSFSQSQGTHDDVKHETEHGSDMNKDTSKTVQGFGGAAIDGSQSGGLAKSRMEGPAKEELPEKNTRTGSPSQNKFADYKASLGEIKNPERETGTSHRFNADPNGPRSVVSQEDSRPSVGEIETAKSPRSRFYAEYVNEARNQGLPMGEKLDKHDQDGKLYQVGSDGSRYSFGETQNPRDTGANMKQAGHENVTNSGAIPVDATDASRYSVGEIRKPGREEGTPRSRFYAEHASEARDTAHANRMHETLSQDSTDESRYSIGEIQSPGREAGAPEKNAKSRFYAEHANDERYSVGEIRDPVRATATSAAYAKLKLEGSDSRFSVGEIRDPETPSKYGRNVGRVGALAQEQPEDSRSSLGEIKDLGNGNGTQIVRSLPPEQRKISGNMPRSSFEGFDDRDLVRSIGKRKYREQSQRIEQVHVDGFDRGLVVLPYKNESDQPESHMASNSGDHSPQSHILPFTNKPLASKNNEPMMIVNASYENAVDREFNTDFETHGNDHVKSNDGRTKTNTVDDYKGRKLPNTHLTNEYSEKLPQMHTTENIVSIGTFQEGGLSAMNWQSSLSPPRPKQIVPDVKLSIVTAGRVRKLQISGASLYGLRGLEKPQVFVLLEKILRSAGALFALISFAVMVSNSEVRFAAGSVFEVKYNDILSYRFLVALNVIAFVYSSIQTVLLYKIEHRRRILSSPIKAGICQYLIDQLFALLLFSASSSAATACQLSYDGFPNIWAPACSTWTILTFCSKARAAIVFSFLSSISVLCCSCLSGFFLLNLLIA